MNESTYCVRQRTSELTQPTCTVLGRWSRQRVLPTLTRLSVKAHRTVAVIAAQEIPKPLNWQGFQRQWPESHVRGSGARPER